MTGRGSPEADEVLDALFVAAKAEQRRLSADEVMRAIGLKRTSINSTYAHVNERRKAHNLSISSDASGISSNARNGGEVATLRITLAEVRRELVAEQKRSERYAVVIRQLALENHQIKHGDGVITDARGRFGGGPFEAR